MPVTIETFRAEHTERFGALNRVWLVQFNLLEPPDEEQFADPLAHFIAPGGQIFIAVDDGVVVGSCAVVRVAHEAASSADSQQTHDVYEICKLAVDPSVQGGGVGRQLVERCIAFARQKGATRLELISNSQLKPALRLYESLGFRYAPVPESNVYETADVFMVLDLELKPVLGSRNAP